MELLYVKNWVKFQHYKDRSPPWIKLETNTFQNYEFSQMSDASKLLALCIWTLASKTKDGSFPADLEYIKQFGMLKTIKQEHLKELINQGFIIDASNLLADCKQSARPEERRGEGEKSREEYTSDFQNFWNAYPKRKGSNPKDKAKERFITACMKLGSSEKIISSAKLYAAMLKREGTDNTPYVAQAVTWLNQSRWNDDYANPQEAKHGYVGM